MSCMNLGTIVPELILATTALMLVPLAGWTKQRRALPTWVAAAGLTAAMATSLVMVGQPSRQVFCGTYAVDGLAIGFKVLLTGAALISLALMDSYFSGRHPHPHAPVALVMATLGGVGLAASVDLGLIVLFLQLLAMASYLMVALERTSRAGNEATYKLFIYSAVALAIMAYGLTFLYGLTGSLNLVTIGTVLWAGQIEPIWVVLAVALVTVGYAFEATLVPFHFWAPDVYAGATAPVAGFLSVLPKLAGFAGLIRFLELALRHQPGWPVALAVMAGLTMTWGNLAALRQTSLKRLLAYSSIAQAGYILMGVVVLDNQAVGYYLGAYLLMNLAAFAIVGRWERCFGKADLEVLEGAAWNSPAAAAVLAIALLSLAGIPPLAGFAGKVFLLRAAMAGGYDSLAVVAVINMAIGLYYYLRVLSRVYLTDQPTLPIPIHTGIGHQLACGACTLATLLLGLFPSCLLEWSNCLTDLVL
ncbi:MAG: NADH-quinone oxidoreductase subunit N [Vulcanimicrobiota bacterium]